MQEISTSKFGHFCSSKYCTAYSCQHYQNHHIHFLVKQISGNSKLSRTLKKHAKTQVIMINHKTAYRYSNREKLLHANRCIQLVQANFQTWLHQLKWLNQEILRKWELKSVEFICQCTFATRKLWTIGKVSVCVLPTWLILLVNLRNKGISCTQLNHKKHA